METKFTFVLLTFGVLVGTVTAFVYTNDPHGLQTTQTKFDNCNKVTYSQLEKKTGQILTMFNNLKNQLTQELKDEMKKFKNTGNEAVKVAKKDGKTVDETCVKQELSKIENGLNVSHKKSVVCLEEANKNAIKMTDAARKNYLQVSSKGYDDTKPMDKKLAMRSCKTDVDCMAQLTAAIQKKFDETVAESKRATETSIEASNKQHDDANVCFGTFHTEHKILHEQVKQNLQKCFG